MSARAPFGAGQRRERLVAVPGQEQPLEVRPEAAPLEQGAEHAIEPERELLQRAGRRRAGAPLRHRSTSTPTAHTIHARSQQTRDNGWVYGSDFPARASRLGIRTGLTPVRAPRANAVAERPVGTLRRECYDHLIIWNEAHLRAVLSGFAAYDNAARPHRGLQLEPPLAPHHESPTAAAPRRARPALGGLHHVCRRAARS
jgi:hypothetical protein